MIKTRKMEAAETIGHGVMGGEVLVGKTVLHSLPDGWDKIAGRGRIVSYPAVLPKSGYLTDF